MAYISFSMRDKNGELGNVRLPMAEPSAITGAGSIAIEWDDVGGGELKDAVEGVTLGVIARGYFGIGEFDDVPDYPASNFAQREWGLRIFLTGDEDGRTFTITLPTVDAAALTLQTGEDDVLLADGGAMAELVTEFEDALRYPSQGASDEQTVTVERARLVGRNS